MNTRLFSAIVATGIGLGGGAVVVTTVASTALSVAGCTNDGVPSALPVVGNDLGFGPPDLSHPDGFGPIPPDLTMPDPPDLWHPDGFGPIPPDLTIPRDR